MPDKQSVIERLNGIHAVACGLGNDQCYLNGIGIKQLVMLINDATELLKAQEPRVMTWDELKEWHRTAPVKREPIFVEYQDEAVCGPSRWHVVPFGLGALDEGTKRIYNKYARCWTSRPTDAQREATPWQGQS